MHYDAKNFPFLIYSKNITEGTETLQEIRFIIDHQLDFVFYINFLSVLFYNDGLGLLC